MRHTKRVLLVVGAAVVGALYAWGQSPVRQQPTAVSETHSFHSLSRSLMQDTTGRLATGA